MVLAAFVAYCVKLNIHLLYPFDVISDLVQFLPRKSGEGEIWNGGKLDKLLKKYIYIFKLDGVAPMIAHPSRCNHYAQ